MRRKRVPHTSKLEDEENIARIRERIMWLRKSADDARERADRNRLKCALSGAKSRKTPVTLSKVNLPPIGDDE